MVHQSVDEVTNNLVNEQQSDVDFLCSLQRVTSLNDAVCDDGDSSWRKLVHGPIVVKPTLMSPSHRQRRQHRPQSPLRSDENAASCFAKRSLFSRRASPETMSTLTPLRDIGNTTPKSSYRRCASDTAATDWNSLRPTPLAKSHSMSTATVLMTDTHNNDERLVGDFTRPLCLPLVNNAKHCDLNSISHDTVCVY